MNYAFIVGSIHPIQIRLLWLKDKNSAIDLVHFKPPDVTGFLETQTITVMPILAKVAGDSAVLGLAAAAVRVLAVVQGWWL